CSTTPLNDCSAITTKRSAPTYERTPRHRVIALELCTLHAESGKSEGEHWLSSGIKRTWCHKPWPLPRKSALTVALMHRFSTTAHEGPCVARGYAQDAVSGSWKRARPARE